MIVEATSVEKIHVIQCSPYLFQRERTGNHRRGLLQHGPELSLVLLHGSQIGLGNVARYRREDQHLASDADGQQMRPVLAGDPINLHQVLLLRHGDHVALFDDGPFQRLQRAVAGDGDEAAECF